jgi:hypothetical protein
MAYSLSCFKFFACVEAAFVVRRMSIVSSNFNFPLSQAVCSELLYHTHQNQTYQVSGSVDI